MNKEPSNSSKTWIVKASDTILGPFSIEELAKAVRTRHVGLLDEAQSSKRPRWTFIRDIAELQQAISELMNVPEEDTSERTQTAAHTQLSVTKRLDDDYTPVPDVIPVIPTTSASTPVQPAPVARSQEPVRSYGLKVKRQPIPVLKILLGFVAGAAIVLAATTMTQKRLWETEQKKYWTQFQQLYAAQLYDDAYKKLKSYQKDYPDQPSSLTKAGFLYLNPGRELVTAKRLFERSSRLDAANKELMVQNLNGLGLVALYEGQLSQAKTHFERAITLEPNHILTRINLISLSMSRALWTEAWKLSEQLMEQENKKALLIQASLVMLSPHHRDHARNVLADLVKSVDNSSYLREEMRLMAIRLASGLNDTLTLESQLQAFFSDLPSLQLTYSENPILDQRWRDWNFLYQFCSEVKGSDELQAELLALQVVCVSQIQKWSEAERIISEGLKRFPNHPRLLSAQLHMLTSMGRWPEVRALMRLQPLTSLPAASWMFAKSCVEENNRPCAEAYLNPLAQTPVISTPVHELRAQMQYIDRNYEACRYSITQGLEQDPLATELLRLRYTLESSL